MAGVDGAGAGAGAVAASAASALDVVVVAASVWGCAGVSAGERGNVRLVCAPRVSCGACVGKDINVLNATKLIYVARCVCNGMQDLRVNVHLTYAVRAWGPKCKAVKVCVCV